MKRLRIAVDCDDVLFPGRKSIVDIYNRLYGTQVSLQRAQNPVNEEWGVDKDEALSRIAEIQQSDEYNQLDPIVGSAEIVRDMGSRYELYLVTARHESLHDTTSALIEWHFPNCFRDIYHVGDSSKGIVCSRIQADVLIDDNRRHLVDASQYGVSDLFWFGEYPWQDKKDVAEDLIRCHNWAEVETEIERIAARS